MCSYITLSLLKAKHRYSIVLSILTCYEPLLTTALTKRNFSSESHTSLHDEDEYSDGDPRRLQELSEARYALSSPRVLARCPELCMAFYCGKDLKPHQKAIGYSQNISGHSNH